MKTLFHKDLCDREFGSAVLHVQTLLRWAGEKGLHLRTVPALDDYDIVQAEVFAVAIERGAMPENEDTAAAIVAVNPILADDRAAEVAPRWLVGAEAHRQWRIFLTKAVEAGELQLLDVGSLLPVSAAPSGTSEKAEPPAATETTADTTGMVAWQAAILENIKSVTQKSGGNTTARQVLMWCRAHGPRDVFPKEQPDERNSFAWIDTEGNQHTNQLGTVNNVWSAWRKAGKIPAKR